MRSNERGKRLALALGLGAVAIVAIGYEMLFAHDPTKPDAPIHAGATPVLRGSGEALPGQGSLIPDSLKNKKR